MNCSALLIYSVKHIVNHHLCNDGILHVEVKFELLLQHVENIHLDVSDCRIIWLLQVWASITKGWQ